MITTKESALRSEGTLKHSDRIKQVDITMPCLTPPPPLSETNKYRRMSLSSFSNLSRFPPRLSRHPTFLLFSSFFRSFWDRSLLSASARPFHIDQAQDDLYCSYPCQSARTSRSFLFRNLLSLPSIFFSLGPSLFTRFSFVPV